MGVRAAECSLPALLRDIRENLQSLIFASKMLQIYVNCRGVDSR